LIIEDRPRRLRRGRRSQRPPVAARGSAPRRPRAVRPLLGPRARTVALVAAVLALLGGAWLWVRDSSLVAVHRVTVTGISGPDSGQIRRALTAAASNMTTLDVRMNDLRTAVAPYPVVKTLHVSTQFPHGMRIKVVEQIPVGAIVVGGRSIPVAGDATLLHDVVATGSLPSIPVRALPAGSSVTDAQARGAVAVLAAAPYQLLAHISQVTSVATHGLVAQIRAGPSIYFGDTTRLQAKWSAAAEVLADPGSAGAVYIDVTDPRRPAAGADAGSGTSTSGTSSAPSAGPPTADSSTPSGG
jgi:cell division protein FtsQ